MDLDVNLYYMCTLGEIYQAAVPALFKSGSETQISLNQMLDTDTLDLDDRSFILVEALKHQKVMQQDVQELLGIKQIQSLLRKLVMNNVILLQEEVRDVYKPKVRKLIRLTERFQDEEALRQLFDELKQDSQTTACTDDLFAACTRRGSGKQRSFVKRRLKHLLQF